nr:MAG TPA: hypothetical protein [Caudoviricetes sp.]
MPVINLIICAFRVIYSVPKGKRKHLGGHQNEGNQNI